MTRSDIRETVLAVHLFSRGVAYTVFESPLSLIDWGIKDIRGDEKNARCLAAVKALAERYQPDAMVFFDGDKVRSERIRRLKQLIVNYASGQAIDIMRYLKHDVRACFVSMTGAKTRHEVAEAIASQIPALQPQLPPVRRIWMSEDPRMALFDAASVALTFYVHRGIQRELAGME